MWLHSLVILAAAGMGTPPPMSNHVAVKNAWFRALPAHLPAGGYLELHNSGQSTATLTGVDSPACGMLMLHKSEQKGGMDTMSHVSNVDIAPGETVTFAPGGLHLMCTEPGPTVKPGGSISVTLKFMDNSVRTVRFAVKTASGQ